MVNSLMRSVWREGLEWYRSILEAIPGETGCKIRNALYGYRAQSGCRVLRGVIIYSPAKLVLGRNVGISPHTQLNAAGGIEIGDDTLIGPGCMIWSVNHRFEDLDAAIRCQGYEPAKITIGRSNRCRLRSRSRFCGDPFVRAGVHSGWCTRPIGPQARPMKN
jgi:acetyltransferase-like isoleucine patch superfamily enzyme